MAGKKKDLSDQKKISLENPKEVKISIVVSEWNEKIAGALKQAAFKTLQEAGIPKSNISQLSVPGTFELPMGAKIANRNHSPHAIICIGCVIKGETDHDKYINQSVASAIQMLNLSLDKPVIFGVLTPNNMQQAKDRAGGSHGNKGVEAAYTALHMIKIQKPTSKKKIGY